MKVGIIGSGDVGKTLGRGFAAHGHSVKLGSRTPDSEKLKEWRKEAHGDASTGTFAEAASYGDVIVFAPLGSAVDDVIGLAGAKSFSGKIVIDTTNALDFSKGMPPGLFSKSCKMLQHGPEFSNGKPWRQERGNADLRK